MRGGLLAVVLLAVLAAPAAGEDGAALLQRYAPVIRYDNSERYFAQPVSLPPGSADVRSGDVVYGHVAEQGAAEIWLQYWFFYAYNPQDRGIVRTGRHEGDWEMVQLRLGAGGVPDRATLAQHSWAESCPYDELEQAEDGAAVIYVANGSHAAYASAGTHDRPFPDPDDEADGNGREVRPRVVEIDDEAPSWVASQGPWGDTEVGLVPGEQSSPVGPRFQEGGAWQQPASFDHDVGRPCGSGAPGRWWQTALMAGVVAILAFAALVAVRRRLAA